MLSLPKQMMCLTAIALRPPSSTTSLASSPAKTVMLVQACHTIGHLISAFERSGEAWYLSIFQPK